MLSENDDDAWLSRSICSFSCVHLQHPSILLNDFLRNNLIEKIPVFSLSHLYFFCLQFTTQQQMMKHDYIPQSHMHNTFIRVPIQYHQPTKSKMNCSRTAREFQTIKISFLNSSCNFLALYTYLNTFLLASTTEYRLTHHHSHHIIVILILIPPTIIHHHYHRAPSLPPPPPSAQTWDIDLPRIK